MLNDSNWQDTFLGGAILAGFIVTAVVAAFFTWVSWDHPNTAQHSSSTVGSTIETKQSGQEHEPTYAQRAASSDPR